MYIEVLTQITSKAVDQYYTYKVPDKYKDKIPQRLYKAMYEYEIEMND